MVVAAAEHRQRDGWVDDQARTAPPGDLVEVSDETYRGLWRIPTPERTLVHVFADQVDAPALLRAGLEQVTACDEAEACMFDRRCPQWAGTCSTIRVDDDA